MCGHGGSGAKSCRNGATVELMTDNVRHDDGDYIGESNTARRKGRSMGLGGNATRAWCSRGKREGGRDRSGMD